MKVRLKQGNSVIKEVETKNVSKRLTKREKIYNNLPPIGSGIVVHLKGLPNKEMKEKVEAAVASVEEKTYDTHTDFIPESDDNYVPLTRAEYDALPDTKYSDGISYYITDEDYTENDEGVVEEEYKEIEEQESEDEEESEPEVEEEAEEVEEEIVSESDEEDEDDIDISSIPVGAAPVANGSKSNKKKSARYDPEFYSRK